MKKLIIALVTLALFALNASAQTKKKSGAIEFATTVDPSAMIAASGVTLPAEVTSRIPSKSTVSYELLFTPTQASYMGVEETEDSNGGGNNGGFGRMMMRFGGGGNKQYFYAFADKKLTEVFDLSDTTYYMDSKLRLSPLSFAGRAGFRTRRDTGIVKAPEPPKIEVVKTDSTKDIIGFKCKQVIIKSTRKMNILGTERDVVDETQLWYTDDLGFDFSPNPDMWTEGAVLAIIGKGSSTIAQSVDYRHVAASDVTAPKKATLITQADYEAKQRVMMQNMRNRFGGGQGRRNN